MEGFKIFLKLALIITFQSWMTCIYTIYIFFPFLNGIVWARNSANELSKFDQWETVCGSEMRKFGPESSLTITRLHCKPKHGSLVCDQFLHAECLCRRKLGNRKELVRCPCQIKSKKVIWHSDIYLVIILSHTYFLKFLQIFYYFSVL